MGNLTEDLIIDILVRLPVKSIIKFSCVCKVWHKLLNNNTNLDFVKLKLKYDIEIGNNKLLLTKGNLLNSINYDPLSLSATSRPILLSDEIVKIDHPAMDAGTRILSTCNGLIFASTPIGYDIYIWNPVTKEYKILPYTKSIMCRMRYVYEIGCGFGYDCGIEDYKVVAIVHDKNSNYSDVEVYTLGLDTWRMSSSIPYRLAKGGPAGVFFNGALNWLAQSCSGTKLQVLLSFDMKDEIFVEIHQPENLDKFNYKFVGVLGGCLSMLCSVGKVGFEVWVMQDYGVKESWTTLFKIDQLMSVDIPSFHYLRRIVSLKNGEILLEIRLDGEQDDTTFIVYDQKREKARVVKILKMENEILRNHSRIFGIVVKSRVEEVLYSFR